MIKSDCRLCRIELLNNKYAKKVIKKNLVYNINQFVFAVAIPFAEIAQGLIINEKSLVAGGIIGLTVGIVTVCCIAGGITLVANWYMPLFIIAFAAMMIVPGHILNHKARKEA